CVHVTDLGVGYVSTITTIRVLYLRWCTQLRDFGLTHVCNMRNLEILSLAGKLILSISLSFQWRRDRKGYRCSRAPLLVGTMEPNTFVSKSMTK
ncbi:hypothetical protein AVEN_116259-1, partial [Araneus ventricosus]